MRDDLQQSRFNQRSKRRKTNLILNGLIGIVLVLIIVVSAFIFMGDSNDTTTEKESEQSVETSSAVKEKEKEEDSSTKDNSNESSEVEEGKTSADTSTTDDESSEEASANEDEEVVVTEGGSDPNVVRTIVNPNWKPIGTVQTGEHTNVYGGVDWEEMVGAIEYATGLSKDNMTIQFLGNDGHNKSKGTVFSKDKTQIYRVSIEWVDGEGWKPTLVEELSSIE